jgi:glycosyltransferase involved in cell wall biosynthesis
MKPKISVIIPACNAQKYISEAIDSVSAASTSIPLEIIVVNDGSTDGTSDIVSSMNAILLEKEKGGAASARNAGLKASSGELIAFLDADDVYAPDALDMMYRTLCGYSADAVFAMTEDFVSPDLSEEERTGLPVRRRPYAGILPGSSLIRRQVFDKIGFFNETLSSGETVEWLMKLNDSGLKTVQMEQTVLNRRIHLTNTGRLHRMQEMQNYAAVLRMRNKKKQK